MSSIVARLREMGNLDRAIADEVRRSLIESLFASASSLGIGAVSGAVAAATIAFSTGDPWLQLLAVAISLAGLGRMVHAAFFYRPAQASAETARSEVLYQVGAWTFAILLGLLMLFTLNRSPDPLLHLFAGIVTIGYAAGISVRNAGRPVIALGQLGLAAGSLSIGLLISDNPLRWILGTITFMFIIGMIDIILQKYLAMLDTIAAVEGQKLLATRFEQLARHDAMTGLENRGAFLEALRTALIERAANKGRLAVLWIDIDKFKEINDSLGHSSGDEVLCSVARQLTSIVKGRGRVARFGGDEFVLLAAGEQDGFAEELAREVLGHLSVPIDIEGVSIGVSASIGAAVAPEHGCDAEILLQHADMALYNAKAKGRNGYCMFEAGMAAAAAELRALEAALRLAVERNELEVYYQPIVDLESGRVTCCEALLRWHHAELGMVPPARFIPIAESIGLISSISHWVLEQACAAAATWPADVTVAVNMSPALLKDLQLPHLILSTLYTSGLPAHRLELEITESLLLEDSVQSNSLIKELQKIGLKLSLDDFGTGYSSLTYLMKYDFSKIKIDTTFIASVTESKEARAIIHALVDLTGELGMEIVAEGIETASQLAFVTGVGCTGGQGFLLGRPAPGRVIRERLNMQSRAGGETAQARPEIHGSGRRAA